MGWLDSLMDKGVEKGVKTHARNTCHAMVYAAMRFERQGECNTYAEVAARALECRIGWERIEGMTFKHKGGLTLEIDPDWSVAHVTREVVAVEIADMVGNLPSPKPAMLVADALVACDEYFTSKTRS